MTILLIDPQIININTTPLENKSGAAGDNIAIFIYYLFTNELLFIFKPISYRCKIKIVLINKLFY